MKSAIHSARKHIDELRVALLSPLPEGIERQLPGLQQAITCLESVQRQDGAATTGRAAEHAEAAAALQLELHTVTRLLENGRLLNEGWGRMLSGLAAGYLPTGQARPLEHWAEGTRTLVVRG